MTTFAAENIPFLALPWKRLQDRQQLPDCAAIYFVCDAQSKVLYIGQTTSLVKRWYGHERRHACQEVSGCRIAWLVVNDPSLLHAIEKACISYFCPPWNGDGAGDTRISHKISQEAQRLLRLIAAQTGEKQYVILERLLRTEWARVHPQNLRKES